MQCDALDHGMPYLAIIASNGFPSLEAVSKLTILAVEAFFLPGCATASIQTVLKPNLLSQLLINSRVFSCSWPVLAKITITSFHLFFSSRSLLVR